MIFIHVDLIVIEVIWSYSSETELVAWTQMGHMSGTIQLSTELGIKFIECKKP